MTGLVQVAFQEISGTYPFAEAKVVELLVEDQ
jgi:hypothetical protein